MGRYVDAEGWMASAAGFGRRAYRAYVPHSLTTWRPALGADSAEAITVADRALAATAALPQTGLSGTLAAWMMTRDESIRSSVMEGVASTGAGLEWARYLHQADRPVSDDNDALTLGATRQVTAAVALGQQMLAGTPAETADILEVHRCLFAGTRERDLGGTLRDGPIWIGPPGCLVEEASFVPPPADRVLALLNDLVEYMNTSRHPTVLKAAAVHAQFETIHPFEDGNGRTGRALVHTVLVAAGLTRCAVPISDALSRDRFGYYQALDATRVVCKPDDDAARGAAMHDWLSVFSAACSEANRQAVAAARDVERMVAHWRRAAQFRKDSAAAKLMEVLPSMPVLDVGMVAARLGVTDRTARRALSSLASAGIVRHTGGRRNQRYTVPEIVGVLRQMAPDGGLPQRHFPSADAPAPPAHAPREQAECSYVGPRSGERCALPTGHKGQHRYS